MQTARSWKFVETSVFGVKVHAWLGSGVEHAVEGHGDVDTDLCPGQFGQRFGVQHQEEAWSLCAWFHHHTQQHTCAK